MAKSVKNLYHVNVKTGKNLILIKYNTFKKNVILKFKVIFYHSALIMPFIVNLFKKIHTGF